MKGRKLLAAALLAGMVSSPVVMAEVLSDEALGEVSAQGLQIATQTTGAHVENINNDSVQLNANAQSGANGMTVTNASASATNVGQNVAGVVGSSARGRMSQRNDQYANNAEESVQYGYQLDADVGALFGIYADLQNMNNGSAQLNGEAQSHVHGMIVSNVASSATNAAQNVAGLTNSQDGGALDAHLYQTNVQVAENTGANDQDVMQIDADVDLFAVSIDLDRQNINNGSAQLNNGAQSNAQVMVLTNVASSAANTAQNIAGVADSDVDNISQKNDQYASNERLNTHLAGQGEGSGEWFSVNIDLDRQNINNGSVQVNDDAQSEVQGMVVANVASSASNVAQNIAGVTGSSTGAVANDISQSNSQVALNDAVNAQGSAQVDLDTDFGVLGASIDLDRQNTNNGSVQLNDNAQSNAKTMVLANVASSALNVGENIVGIIDSSGDDVRQYNNQYAVDSSYNEQYANSLHIDDIAIAYNVGEVNTNNESVQLNGSAQASASGMALVNAAGAAVNVGQNVMGMVNGYTGTITQTNVQSALNY